jgi:penicillin-binding protein 1A
MGFDWRKPSRLEPSFSPAPVKKRRSRAKLLFLSTFYGAVFAGGAYAAALVYCSAVYPDPLSLRKTERAALVRVLARDGALIAERGGIDDYAPLDLLPRHTVDAVLATEDQRFYSHRGIDPWGLLRAGIVNARAQRFVQGGSTLTQQLAKNLYLSSDRTFARKIEEVALALWLEARLSKADILELYLNRVYLGAGTYGIDAAAHRYFGKSARKLTLAESAVIAGLLKAPSRYSPFANPDSAAKRARLVLAQMLAARMITPEEEASASFAVGSIVKSGGAGQRADGSDYAIDYVLDQLPAGAATGSEIVTVETTLDKDLLTRAASIVARTLAESGSSLQAGQAAVVVLDGDGGIRALVGGGSYAGSQYNRAVKALRQPGSTFKPFVYLAALEAGLTPDSMVEDLPISVGGWAPRNDNGEYQGSMTLRSALARSVNTVAVRLALKVGPGRVAATARRLGIKSPLSKDASLALGTSEVNLLELSGAYNVLANGGKSAEPHVIRRVYTRAGRMLFVRKPFAPTRVVNYAQVSAMNEMLAATLTWGTGRRAALPDRPAAGKTGTSQGFRDAWFIGYTAQLTTGVWAGNDDGRAMNHVVGGSLPAAIWREVMIAAHAGKPTEALAGTMMSAVAAPQAGPAPSLLPSGRAAPTSAPAAATLVHPGEPIDAEFFARAADAAQARPQRDGIMSLGASGE